MRPGRPLESAAAWYSVLGAAAALVLCVQSVSASELGWSVDLTPIFVAFFAVELELIAGLAMTAAVAYGADALSGAPPGLVMAGYSGAFLALRLLVRRSPLMSPPAIVFLSVLAALASLAARFAVHATLGQGAPPPAEPWSRLAAIAIAAVPLYGLLRRVGEPFRPRDEAGLRR